MQGQFYTAETTLLAKAFHRLCMTLFVAPLHLMQCILLHQKKTLMQTYTPMMKNKTIQLLSVSLT